jgi:glycosyltransferase involved in cell wall biosynthesis
MGGAEQIVRTIAREAARCLQFDHIDVCVLCWSRTGTLDDLEALGNVTLNYRGAKSIFTSVFPCVRVLVGSDYDLVVSSNTLINAVASGLRRLRLLKTRQLVARESSQIFDRNFGVRSTFIRALYRAYGSQDLIVCQTQRMLQTLNESTGSRLQHLLKVIPNPIDFNRIEAGRSAAPPVSVATIPRERTKIVWCGRLSPVKYPLRAVETLCATHDLGRADMHLVMIGEGPLRGEVEGTAKRLGLEDFVTLVGQQANPISTMACCDLGLLTSNREGFPNVILEMLAAGVKTVVTTDCAGGLREIPGVVAVEPDATALAAALVATGASPPGDGISKQRRDFLMQRAPDTFLRQLHATQGAERLSGTHCVVL